MFFLYFVIVSNFVTVIDFKIGENIQTILKRSLRLIFIDFPGQLVYFLLYNISVYDGPAVLEPFECVGIRGAYPFFLVVADHGHPVIEVVHIRFQNVGFDEVTVGVD